MNIYDFTVKDRDGKDVNLADYKGKVLLVINSATECGFTPQYKGLQEIYNKYHEKGLEILDFPCNQFGSQAPGTDSEIHTFCTGRFGITFPQFAKIDVNGENESPLFAYLKNEKPFKGFGEGKMADLLNGILSKIDKDFANKADIKWNFTKFLIDREGNIINRYESTFTPEKLDGEIAKII